jgi:hypothetical protein
MPNYGPQNYNCLAGCIENYAAGPVQKNTPYIRAGGKAENFAPVIVATILEQTGSNKSPSSNPKFITVGNESYPYNPHKAVIKSIEFGFIDAPEGRLEIVDEDGGSFSVFLDSVLKCGKGGAAAAGSGLRFKLGWAYSKCDGSGSVEYSDEIEATIQGIESSISNGVIKYTINFAAAHTLVQMNRHDFVFGEEEGGKEMTIEQAIERLASIPPSIQVRYARYDKKGKLKFLPKHKWVGGDKKAAWRSDSQNKYSTIMKWLEPFRIDDGPIPKGVVLVHDPKVPDVLLVLQDGQANCFEKIEISGSDLFLGTYIVNGGKCSNVLEFSPTVNFINALFHKSSGGSTDASSSKSNLKEDDEVNRISCKSTDLKDVGTQSTTTATGESQYIYGNRAGEQSNISSETHIKANMTITTQPITAELRIVGTIESKFYRVANQDICSIVVINPNHIEKRSFECGDFLKRASCHPFFSNKQWRVQGINHAIREGSFVTTLKVFLETPGGQLSSSNTLGANSSGSTVSNTCGP